MCKLQYEVQIFHLYSDNLLINAPILLPSSVNFKSAKSTLFAGLRVLHFSHIFSIYVNII